MARKLNILMLGGAKRVSMGRLLIDAAARKGFEAKIFSCELDRTVPVAVIGEIVTCGRWSDPDIIDRLHDICLDKDIDIMLPFVDGAVEVAARYCIVHSEVWSPVSSPEMSHAMFDKVMCDDMLRGAAIPLPRRCYLDSELSLTCKPAFYPVIAKPRCGSASKGIIVFNNEKEWHEANINADGYLLQEYIANRREYTIDCYVDRRGNIAAASPRLRLEVTGGEVSRTVTVDLPEGVGIACKAIGRLGLRGAVTVQLIEDAGTGRLMFMEINPRLGGGAVCSVRAGADIPSMIIDDWQQCDVKPMNAAPGIVMARYMQEVMFDANGNII